jgi:hypothetical protein
MKRTLLLAASALGLMAGTGGGAVASSHREAPMIAGMPRLDASDFYMFRSYETGRSAFMTVIADYVPLQDPAGGPNFYQMEHNGYYDINLDTKGTGTPTYTFRFRFYPHDRKLSLDVGGKTVAIPLINDGPITRSNFAAQNELEYYTMSLVTYSANGTPTETLIADTQSGRTYFLKPVDNIGQKSIANYPAYAQALQYEITIPGCATPGKMFAGQRKDPFVVNLGETFDLINYANPIGETYDASASDDLANKNVTSLALELPFACFLNGSDPVIGGYTTSSMGIGSPNHVRGYTQVSRLANPLVNELVIGIKDKDNFNGSVPANDAQFLTYVSNPTVPLLIQTLFPSTKAPSSYPRTDLEAVFLTGVAGVNQPKSVTPSEEMRLNTSIAPTAYGSQNRLGVIAGDNAGYPNGRRPGDDVVDITLRVAMGRLITLGLFPGTAPSGGLDFTDGAYTDDTHYDQTWPYVRPPLPGSPQSAE